MRIIKPGRELKKEIEQTCERCGCVFAYGEKDIVKIQDGFGVMFRGVICPCCDKTIIVKPWSVY